MVNVCSGTCDKANEFDANYVGLHKYETTGTNLNIGDVITSVIENDDWCTDYDHDETAMAI